MASKPNPRIKHRGISRIDQASRRTYGWYVRAQIDGVSYAKFFSDASYGGKTKALALALAHRDQLLAKKAASGGRRRGVAAKATGKAPAKATKAPAKRPKKAAGAGARVKDGLESAIQPLQSAAERLLGMFGRLRSS